MAEEEFQESDVIFSDNDESTADFDHFREIFHGSSKHGRFIKSAKTDNDNNKIKDVVNSVPVNIPDSVFRFGDNDEFDRDWIDGVGELIPPHVIVRQRIFGGKMAYSLCTGTGRTLKGRDLSRVRNSILRLTGFLET